MDQSGFALLEVIVSALILSFGAIGIALMFGTGQADIQVQGDDRVTLSLARQKLEELRAGGFDNLAVTDTNATGGPTQALGVPEAIPRNPTSSYERNWSVVCLNRTNFATRVACPSSVDAKMITVTVDTPANAPNPNSVTLQAVLLSR